MALTDHCDLFASVHEEGVNRVVRHIQLQRPSLFNYGSSYFSQDPGLFCQPIKMTADVVRRGNPFMTIEPPIPILNTGFVLEWCMQLVDLDVDFHPGNLITLPPQPTTPLPMFANPLAIQRVALHVRVCVGIGAPHRLRDKGQEGPPDKPDIPTRGAQTTTCFCLDVFAVAGAFIANNKLNFSIGGIEIVDITPDGLEFAIETYLALVLQLGILPKLAVALDQLVFNLGSYATIALSPTPISSAVPFNPSIANDRVSGFINATI